MIESLVPVLPYLLGVIAIAYLLGSLPTGYLAGKWLMGIDLREHGSGSTGATNVLRTLGKVPGGIVLGIDAIKGAMAIGCARSLEWFNLLPDSTWIATIVACAAAAVILGHSKSLWLNFSGGKSVATSLGVLLSMCWPVGLATLGVFGITIAISRIVSISSILGAISASIWMWWEHQPLPYIIFTIVGGIYVVIRHKTNIERLLAGTEPKVGQKLSNSLETTPPNFHLGNLGEQETID
jgi:acyl phosphate:glycerol-3-phosphate acyltransferase